MRIRSFLSTQRVAVLLLGCALVIGSSQACGGKVVVDGASSPGAGGAGGTGGHGGHGGGPSDACEWNGPANPDWPCKTEGAQCAYGDTSCFMTWTCMAGKWSEGGGCFSSAVGGG